MVREVAGKLEESDVMRAKSQERKECQGGSDEEHQRLQRGQKQLTFSLKSMHCI